MTVEAPSDRPILRMGSKLQTMNTCRDALMSAIDEFVKVKIDEICHNYNPDDSERVRDARKSIRKAIKDLWNSSSR